VGTYLPLSVADVTPEHGWNADPDPPTSTIRGSAFDRAASVLLCRDGQTAIAAASRTWVDTSTLLVQFDLNGAEPGPWDVVVTNPDSASASFPYTVHEGAPAKLETKLILPSALGFHIAATLYIEYANTGGEPMPAPLLKFHGSQNALLTAEERYAGPGLWTDRPPSWLSDTVQVLALGSDPDPEVLTQRSRN